MPDFLAAVGLVLVLEGLLYAVVPGKMKRMMTQMLNASDDSLRTMGIIALAAGVGLVWLVRAS